MDLEELVMDVEGGLHASGNRVRRPALRSTWRWWADRRAPRPIPT